MYTLAKTETLVSELTSKTYEGMALKNDFDLGNQLSIHLDKMSIPFGQGVELTSHALFGKRLTITTDGGKIEVRFNRLFKNQSKIKLEIRNGRAYTVKLPFNSMLDLRKACELFSELSGLKYKIKEIEAMEKDALINKA